MYPSAATNEFYTIVHRALNNLIGMAVIASFIRQHKFHSIHDGLFGSAMMVSHNLLLLSVTLILKAIDPDFTAELARSKK